MNSLKIKKYLSRIRIDKCAADLEGLTKLQEQHMENIPFENLDIVAGRSILLDIPHLYDKLITRARGGYCFELNTLYAALLESFGFSPMPVLGRVWLSNPKQTPPRNHLAYLLDLDGRTYITDVGFGGLVSRIPLDIDMSLPVNDRDGMVRIIPFADREFMIQRQKGKEWMNLYSFETVAISREDIYISNYYMSTNPNSHFFYHKFVGRNTKEGRIALFNNKMSIRKGMEVVDKKRVDYGDEWLEIIRNEFSLELDFSKKELDLMFENLRGVNNY